MTLDEVKAQFTGLMNRRDLTANTALVGTFIDQAVMRIQRELRVPAMEKSVPVTIAAPYNGLVIPDDLIELISIVPQSTTNFRRLDRFSVEKALNYSLVTGTPEGYCRRGGVWVLGPSPVVGDVIQIDYYAEFTPLVNGTDSNILTDIAWDLMVYAALAAACEFFKDNRLPAFEGRYQQILADLQAQSDDDELDVACVQSAYTWPDDDLGNEICVS